MLPRLLVLLLCFLPLHLLADTVWLTNGDRYSGEIVLLDGGKLVLNTPMAGRVLIDWKGVATLASDKPLLLRREDLDSELQNSLFAGANGTVKLSADAQHSVPLASITRLLPPTKLLGDFKWEGKLDAKVDLHNDDDNSQEWNLKGETRIEHNRWRHVINGETERKEKDQQRTADNWKLDYNLDYFFSRHWFVRATALQDEDRQGDQGTERQLGIGPGYRFWDDELGRLELTGQLTRVSLRYPDYQLAFNTLGLGWDFKRSLWGSRIEATSKGNLQIPQFENVDYLFRSDYGLSYRLSDWTRLSLLYELEQISYTHQTVRNQHYLLGIGVNW